MAVPSLLQDWRVDVFICDIMHKTIEGMSANFGKNFVSNPAKPLIYALRYFSRNGSSWVTRLSS